MKAWPKAIAVGAGCAILAAWIVLEFQTQRRLGSEYAGLRERNREMQRVKDGIEQLRASVAGLSKLQKAQIETSRHPQAQAGRPEHEDPAAAGFTAITDLKNTGAKTAKDAFETYLWALNNLDVPALAKLLWLNRASMAKVEEAYGSLPAADRTRYGSAMEMFAMVYVSQHPTYFSAMQVESPDLPADEPVAPLITKYEYPNGHTTEHHDVLMRRMPDGGWGVTVAGYQAADVLKQLTAPTPQSLPANQP